MKTPRLIRRDGTDAHKQSIGRRIKRLRVQQTRTQAEIAAAAGLTKSMVSKIESGAASPSVAALARLAEALGTNVSSIMEQPGHDHRPVFVPRRTAEGGLTRSDKGYAVFPYATEFVDKAMQPFLFEVRRGKVKKHSVSHSGEEFICVLEGEILFTVGDVQFRMRPGDALFFNALDPHGVVALTETAKYIDVFV
jgi:transcriptional regulator with XRE-family HTH domain